MKKIKYSDMTTDEMERLVDYFRLNKQSRLLFEIMSFSFIGLKSKKDNGIVISKTKNEKIVNGKVSRSTVYTITVTNEEGD